MNDGTTGSCPRCDELRATLATRTALMAQQVDEARAEVARLRAQLRDEERENGSLRRRLREGGR